MIKSFRHKGLKRFHETGSTTGIQAAHARRLRQILVMLDNAAGPADMDAPGLRLHSLKGDRSDDWAVSVDRMWRVTFRFIPDGVELVNYEDYH